METNTLVKHRKLKTLGIGCVAKVLSKSLKVNFGTEDVMTCNPKMLEPVDVSKSKTMTFAEFRNKTFANSWEGSQVRVIIGNELKEYVGIGWITKGVVTEDDLRNYPRII
jgi:hypothetical protein